MTGSEQPTVGQRDLRGMTGGELEAVRIWLLGGFRVSVGSSRSLREDEWHLRKAGNLLKLLALAPGHRLHREETTGLLWPELDAQAAANNLHHALHVARRTLEPSAPDGAPLATCTSGANGWPCAPMGNCGWMSMLSRKRLPWPVMLTNPRPTGRP